MGLGSYHVCAFLALCFPTFFRSARLGSRVSNPANRIFSCHSVDTKLDIARAIARRTAPARADMPSFERNSATGPEFGCTVVTIASTSNSVSRLRKNNAANACSLQKYGCTRLSFKTFTFVSSNSEQ